ncbi:hypothetical protein [Candidatus Thiodictyon syntrophicum]|nr:hypothetical protein [Candidatus Thiodictyon syntrophicum]
MRQQQRRGRSGHECRTVDPWRGGAWDTQAADGRATAEGRTRQ